MCCMRLAENTGRTKITKNSPCTIAQLCRAISSQLRHVSTIGKKLSNSNISSTCSHKRLRSVYQFWAPSTFQRVSRVGFIIAPTSLNGRQPNFARCLDVSWADTLYVHFWGLLPAKGILSGAKFTLRSCLALSYIGSVTAQHSSSGRQPHCGVVQGMELGNFRRGRHLYSAGRPSRWASAHVLVIVIVILLQSSLVVQVQVLLYSMHLYFRTAFNRTVTL